MKKTTIRTRLIKLLGAGWYSNFQINMYMKSSSADREMRRLRKHPPLGMKIIQRKKIVPKGYGNCLEYRLIEDTECCEI